MLGHVTVDDGLKLWKHLGGEQTEIGSLRFIDKNTANLILEDSKFFVKKDFGAIKGVGSRFFVDSSKDQWANSCRRLRFLEKFWTQD